MRSWREKEVTPNLKPSSPDWEGPKYTIGMRRSSPLKETSKCVVSATTLSIFSIWELFRRFLPSSQLNSSKKSSIGFGRLSPNVRMVRHSKWIKLLWSKRIQRSVSLQTTQLRGRLVWSGRRDYPMNYDNKRGESVLRKKRGSSSLKSIRNANFLCTPSTHSHSFAVPFRLWTNISYRSHRINRFTNL